MANKDEELLLGEPVEPKEGLAEITAPKKPKKAPTRKKAEELLGIESKPGEGIRICFDTTQNERGKLEENYTTFKELVEKKGYRVESNLEFPITFRQLTHYDIVVFACPDRSKIREFEINELRKYVKCGGGIIIMASSGGDKGRMTNLSEVCDKFGIKFNNDQVFDDQHNYGIRNLAISTSFIPHPVTDGLELVIIPSSCSLTVSGKAQGVVFSDEDADPPNAPVIAVSEYGLGRIVVLGSYDTFRDNVRAGIQVIQHRIMLDNILKWVVNDPDLARILYALSLLKIRKDKAAKKTVVPLYSSTLPTTKGRLSPEAILDQILSNLQQVRSVGAKLEDINQHLVQVAMGIKKLNEGFASANELANDLKKVKDELTVLKLDKRLDAINERIEGTDTKIKPLDEKLGDVSTKLQELDEKLVRVTKDSANLIEQVNSITADIKMTDKKIDSSDKKLIQFADELQTTNQKLEGVDSQLEKIIKIIISHNEKIDKSKEKIETIEEKEKTIATDIANFSNILSQSNEEIRQLNEKINKTDEKIGNLDEIITKHIANFSTFSKKIETTLSTILKNLESSSD
ncbi:MAG: hypothetical protein ACTSRS_16990 [Candidatus Helarchaeota archaeon]